MSIFHWHRRRSYFPFLIILLSIGLLLFMFYSLSYKQSAPRLQPIDPEVISSREYQSHVRALITTFDEQMIPAQDVESRRVVVAQTLSSLLLLRVPVEFQQAHLQLALSLNAMNESFDSENANFDSALVQWNEAATVLK